MTELIKCKDCRFWKECDLPGLVTMVGKDAVYQITEDESWRVGDRAEAIVRDGRIVEVRWMK